MSVDALGNPLQFQLTAGQAHDITQAEALLIPAPIGYVIADKGYDAETFVHVIRERGAIPVIPPRSNRKMPREYDAHLYKELSSGYDEMSTEPSPYGVIPNT